MEVGLYGLGVMGKALALNLHRNNVKLSVFDRDPKVTLEFAKEKKEVFGAQDVESFVNKIQRPRKIILMITAGKAIDDVLKQLVKYLDNGDIIIDCGNSFYLDTQRRQENLKKQNILFLGCGVSGGEQGALLGPSLMPSGDYEAYQEVEPLLTLIAAKNDDGTVCCDYIGVQGSGHFVKMVHNGIEYAEMQLIAELYALWSQFYGNEAIAKMFDKLNNTNLQSYLIEITRDILRYKENDEYLIDKISDVAQQKGTGKWTAQVAMQHGIAIPSLLSAVETRFLSQLKLLRCQLSKRKKKKNEKNHDKLSFQTIVKGMLFFRLSLNGQGLDLIEKISRENGYQINLSKLTAVWQNGCIIKSTLIKDISKLMKTHDNQSFFLQPDIFSQIMDTKDCAKDILKFILDNDLYAPVMVSSFQYIMGVTDNPLMTNLIQAQRDYFGAHTYQRNDRDGIYHTEWVK